MKQVFILLLTLVAFSCGEKQKTQQEDSHATNELPEQTQEEYGKILFDSRGNCFACHKPEQNVIAPSIIEIARIYKEKDGDMVSFLQGNEEPIVDPERFEVMKTNFSITKNMTEEELEAIVAYIYSFSPIE